MRRVLFMILSTLLVLPCQTLAEEEEGAKEVAYFALNPSFIVNVKDGARFVRADIQVMTSDLEQLENIKLHAPALRHELLLLLSEQKGKVIKTQQGQEEFRKKALQSLQGVISEQTGITSIDDLFFTSFFVQ